MAAQIVTFVKKSKRLFLNFCVWSVSSALILPCFAADAQTKKGVLTLQQFRHRPKLFVVLVVDQFRADYLTRFASRFLPATKKDGQVGGYEYLMSQGAYFPFAQYDILQSMTGPGHATILSGAYPYLMGIPINGWFNGETRQPVYCVEDKKSPEVPSGSEEAGVSPHLFLGSTFGDEMKNAGYPSRVVSVAIKDRAAILLGGHRADLALWFDRQNFKWVSSQYYLSDRKLPAWVDALNASIPYHKGETFAWHAEGRGSGLSLPLSIPMVHQPVIGSAESFGTPMGLELTVDAAVGALKAYHLGESKKAPDLLAVSFSSHDMMGHLYGPNSREMEELTVAEDRAISRLLNAVRKSVPGGLKDVAFVLTADHGVPPSPTWQKTLKVDAGKIHSDDIDERINRRLEKLYGRPASGNWVLNDSDLNFYLNRAAIEAKGLKAEQVEAEAKAELMKTEGAAAAFSRSDYLARRLPPGMYERQILKTYYPGRSGDLILIPKALYATDDDPVNHMTGYTYDRTVPLVITGPEVKPGVHASYANLVDLAPTLSFMAGVLAPNLADGRVLDEIFVSR